jgi:flavorubredoxin
MFEPAQGRKAPTLPRAIAPRTFWFSCCLEVPQGDRILHNHNSCYLLIGDEATVLVDTGMPYGWSKLRTEMRSVLAGRSIDYALPTHPEAQHRFQPMKTGESLDLGGRRLLLLPAVVHDLPNSVWGYEPDQRILFVADALPYTHEHEAHQCGMTSEELPYEIMPKDTSVVIGLALGWARHVDADRIMPALYALMEAYPVDMIGPAHGGVITNPKEITRAFDLGLRGARRS